MYKTKEDFLAELFREMDKRGDFPSISESVWRIVAVMDTEREQFDLVQAILDDFALTQKVLQVANSAMYHRFGQNISTVTQAVVVLGYDMIGHLALGLKLAAELLAAANDRADVRSKRAMAECAFTGSLTRHLAQKFCAPNAEEAGVCGLLHGVGRVLMMFYLPHAWDRVESIMMQDGIDEGNALTKVIHMTSGELGEAVALHWRLPTSLVNSLGEKAQASIMPASPTHAEWLGILARTSVDLTRGLAAAAYVPNEMQIRELAKRHASTLGLRIADFSEAVERALREERESSRVGLVKTVAAQLNYRKVPDALAQLSRLRDSLEREAEKHSIRSLVGMTMEAIYRIFGARRVTLMLKDKDVLRARHAVGWNTAGLLGRFTLETAYAPDVFHVAIVRNIPILITNTAQMRAGKKLHESFLTCVTDDPCFMVLPLCVAEVPVGMLYLDWEPGGELPTLTPKEQQKLVEIRNILVDSLMLRRTPTPAESGIGIS